MTAWCSLRRCACAIAGALAVGLAWAQPTQAPAPAAAAAPATVLFDSADGTRLNALLFHPQPVAGASVAPRPVVVALHGCGGLFAAAGPRKGQLNARHQGMAELLAAQGWSVLFPDSFTARGSPSLCTLPLRERPLRATDRRADVDGALAWLAAQPWTDGRRIALLGWSHGGSTVLAATDARVRDVQARALQPDVAVAFYPGCGDALRAGWQPRVPVVLLLAERDDWTPAQPCIELARRTGIAARVYADSWHDFDNPVGEVRLRHDVPNGAHPGQGVQAGRNPVTGPQAWKDLVKFLKARWE